MKAINGLELRNMDKDRDRYRRINVKKMSFRLDKRVREEEKTKHLNGELQQ